MRKQKFAWTRPDTPRHGYVGFCGAHDLGDGRVELIVREHGDLTGRQSSITLPASVASELGRALIEITERKTP